MNKKDKYIELVDLLNSIVEDNPEKIGRIKKLLDFLVSDIVII